MADLILATLTQVTIFLHLFCVKLWNNQNFVVEMLLVSFVSCIKIR